MMATRTLTVSATAPMIAGQGLVYQECELVRSQDYTTDAWGEISDGAARTIASWWQSPGAVGRHLATLASGLPVELEDLLEDIHRTRREAGRLDDADSRALDMLATWAIHKSRLTEGA